MTIVEIAVPPEPMSAITRHHLEVKMAAARMQWELATAACCTAGQNMLDERQIYDMLCRLSGTRVTAARKTWEFATAAWHAAEQAMINKRRIYDMLGCLLEAGTGHVFSATIITEHGSVLSYCRQCRACAGSIKAREPCADDTHRCPRSVRPGESDTAITVYERKDLLCAQSGEMSPDFTSWTCRLGHVTDRSHAESHVRHIVAHCIPATCPWPDLIGSERSW